ncbi:S-layer homology domain-containing protein [Cohnella herbarum]|uniref:S-layer homology domain-containing protein n=1 Tax=Cohnella herbarum TaxID=2728023 RepID=A0A7Z2VMX2_9BACL|nr:S-layer homology domain-containing protein [Cohnella herbarum]QJD85952.1 S-layer homology domain-containing protein [Cohnella herbarum]
MRKGARIFSAVLLMVTLAFPYLAYAEENIGFKDVGGTYWAQDEINSMAKLGLVKGYSDNTFKPNKPVTREEFAALIARAFYLDLLEDDKSPTFMDVTNTRWSFSAVEASKEFLTGYYPPSGKAFFDPTGKATREDVAVALVKTLNYQPDDLKDERVLDRFYDENEISPNMSSYVALAVENKLINGYSDWTFRPDQAVTRAEAAALLYRAIKGAAGDSQQALTLNVEVPDTTPTPTFYITGDVTKGATVFINNEEAEVVQGQFRVGFRLKEEGTYTYTVTARLAGGKTQSVTKTVKYEKGAPTLEVKGVPETTDKQMITVTWTVKDGNDPSPVVYVNGEKQYSSSAKAIIYLEEGNNDITVVAENSSGKSTKVVKRVVFQSGGPVLNVLNVPETTDKELLKVSWTVQDKNDNAPKVYLNGEQQYGTTTHVNLKEGTNTLTFKAVNSIGKTTEVTKTVVLNGGAPVLTVDPVAESTNKNTIKISWNVQDKNDNSPKVYINGEQAYNSGTTVSLKPGPNAITVKVVNKLGKSTEKSFNVTFSSDGPTLVVNPIPQTTDKKTVQVSWSVSDNNDNYPKVYLNDEQAYGSSMSVSLVAGANTIKIKAVNSFGATKEETHTIVFEPPGPRLVLGYAPETTSSETITLTWTVSDENDSYPKVFVNDKQVNYNSMNVILSPGPNTFRIVASNSLGKTTEVVYTVTYSPTP